MVILTIVSVVLMPLVLAIVCLSRAGLFDGSAEWNSVLDEFDLKHVKSPSKAMNPGLATLEEELQVARLRDQLHEGDGGKLVGDAIDDVLARVAA